MTPTYLKIAGSYDLWLVALSYVVSVAGAFTALELTGRVLEAQRAGTRLAWSLAAAVALGGVGIWSMHFIAILAYRLPIPVAFDVPLTAVSLLAAVLVTWIGLFLVTGRDLSLARLCAAGLFVGSGVCLMHYLGMEAMRMAATLEYEPLIVVLSWVVAVVVATVGLLLMLTMRKGLQRTVSAFVIGFAVSGMHYTAMYGTTCRPTFSPGAAEGLALSGTGMAGAVAAASIGVVLLGLLLSHIGRARGEPLGQQALGH